MAGKRALRAEAVARALPILGWLSRYERRWFLGDLVAGLTLWGILVPEAIAYAAMAGAPVQAGLYTLLGSLVVYALLGTTRQAVSAPTSGSSIMMAVVVAPFLVTNPDELRALLLLLVVVVGFILLLCGLLRLGFVTAFISHSVMTGFVFGLAIHIAVSQASKIFGVPRGHGETIEQLWFLIGQLGGTNWVTFVIGAGGLIFLYLVEHRAPRAPAPLMIMAGGILAVWLLHLSAEHGVQIVGTMRGGLPTVRLPATDIDDTIDLLPGAFAIALFILSEGLAVGHSLGRKHGHEVESNQELIAMGAANLASACLGGLVSGLSMSSTAVNDRAGAKSQVSSLAAASMVLITLVALMPLFRDLPEAILGAVVIHAVVRMMKVDELRRIYRFHVSEFAQTMLALLGVVTIGILPGLGIAVVLSLLRFIWAASHVSVSHQSPAPGLELVRLNGPLFFANAARFRNEVRTLIADGSPPAAILINLHANFGIDLSATDTLLGLVAEAEQTKTEILFAELQDPVLQTFRRTGLLDRVGEDHIFPTVGAAIGSFHRRHSAAASGAGTL